MVNRCVCRDVPFDRLKAIAEANGDDAERLRERTGCGGECGMCFPYLRVMLETGETSVPLDAPFRRPAH